MRLLDKVRLRLRTLFLRHNVERELEAEINFHLDQLIEEKVAKGMAPTIARSLALREIGGIARFQEECRDMRGVNIIESLWKEIPRALRVLRRSPGFTATAVLTLALGIGATTAVFSVVNGVLLKPLPYPIPESLVASETTISATQFFTYRDEGRSFEAFGVWARGRVTVTELAEPEELQSLRVTHGVLQGLGVSPITGRWFSQEDDTPGSPPSVILTNGYWQRRLGGDPSVVGRSLIVDSRPRTIIGVMPAGFRFLTEKPDLILPFQFERGGLVLGAFNYFVIARLKPGVTLAQANADVTRMLPIWLKSWPSPPGFDPNTFERSRSSPALRPLKENVVGDIRDVLWLLMGTIGIVLLVACANVANLLLVRAEERRQELAIRAALGAGWRRIAYASLVENLLLSLLGGVLGLSLAFAAIRLLVNLGPASLPRLTEIAIDPAVMLFSLVVSLVSGLLVGLVPAIRHARTNAAQGLRRGGRTASGDPDRHRARNTLVIVQVALALVLLVGSGLMARTFIALRSVNPGFAGPAEVQLARITIPRTLVEDPERLFGLQSEIRDRIAAIPGVRAAAFASAAPMEPFISANSVFVEDRSGAAGDVPSMRRFKFVSPGFFQTVGASLLAGREFTWTEVVQRRPVAVISENMARDTWQEAPAAIGKRIREAPTGPWREIVGVVEDVFDDGLHAPAPMTVYWPPIMDSFEGERIRVRRSMTFAIRSKRAASEGLLKDIQRAVWAAHASLPVAQIQTLQAIYERSLAPVSFIVVTLVIAAVMALLLGLVGIYCVIAYAVTLRTREIGIRMALGAQIGDVRRLFLRHGLMLTLAGIALGLGVALALTRIMSALLFGVGPVDPMTYAAVSVGLAAVALLATWLPAHRASRIDPLAALRAEI